MSSVLSSSGIWLTQRFRRFQRIADSQQHITRPCKWREWQRPARATVWPPFLGIMLSVSSAPASPLGNRPTNWFCSSMDADESGT